MVSDVMKRTERLALARQILHTELTLAGVAPGKYSSVEVTKAARIYLEVTRHNTGRLRMRLRTLNARLLASATPCP